MVFGPKNTREEAANLLNLTINNEQLDTLNDARNLGVTLDINLRYQKHVNTLIRKAYISLKVLHIYSKRHNFPTKVKINLCESMILSHFNFSDSLCGPCRTETYKRKIQTTQSSCLKLIYGICRQERISYTLTETNWLNMEARRFLHAATLFHKIIVFKTPAYLFEKLTFRTDFYINVRFRGLLTSPIF
nr:unnamed protein product [Callosobruchus chinensis]